MSLVKNEENRMESFSSLDEQKGKDKKVSPGYKSIKDNPNYKMWKRRSLLFFAIGTFFLIGLTSYFYLKARQVHIGAPIVKWFSVLDKQSVKFEPFIIPFDGNGKFTYISLSISFELPNKELKDEMIEKNNQLRGIIYNILSQNINILENVSSLTNLKRFIINGVNGVLRAGKVNEAIITDFSTV